MCLTQYGAFFCYEYRAVHILYPIIVSSFSRSCILFGIFERLCTFKRVGQTLFAVALEAAAGLSPAQKTYLLLQYLLLLKFIISVNPKKKHEI